MLIATVSPADVIESDAVLLARLITVEAGKSIAQSAAEVAKCARGIRFYARNAGGFIADEPLDDPALVTQKPGRCGSHPA